jgi:hypothetical protein
MLHIRLQNQALVIAVATLGFIAVGLITAACFTVEQRTVAIVQRLQNVRARGEASVTSLRGCVTTM